MLLSSSILLTLEFCFTMIWGADIEGSESNVAMNACAVLQASYAYGVWGWSSWARRVDTRMHFSLTRGVGGYWYVLVKTYLRLSLLFLIMTSWLRYVIYIYTVTFLKHSDPLFCWHHCEGDRANIHFRRETWGWQRLVFALLTLEVGVTKT